MLTRKGNPGKNESSSPNVVNDFLIIAVAGSSCVFILAEGGGSERRSGSHAALAAWVPARSPFSDAPDCELLVFDFVASSVGLEALLHVYAFYFDSCF